MRLTAGTGNWSQSVHLNEAPLVAQFVLELAGLGMREGSACGEWSVNGKSGSPLKRYLHLLEHLHSFPRLAATS